MNPYVAIFIGGFVGGVVVHSLVPNFFRESPYVFGTFLLFLSLFLFVYHWHSSVARRYFFIITLALFIGAMGIGILRFDMVERNNEDAVLEGMIGEYVGIEGVVIDEPDVRENSTRITLKVETLIAESGETFSVSSKALITMEHFPQFIYGDRISLTGELRKPKNFARREDESGRSFDYISYLGKSGIFYQMFYPDAEFVEGGQGNFFRHHLFSLKGIFIANVGRVIPEPASSLMGGVVVGAKQALGEELLDDFRRTGIIHIVVLSGYNITIVADAIGKVFSLAPRFIALSFSSTAIIAFALMTGAGATIVRASIMALVVLFARAVGRPHAISASLYLAGFVMVLHNPKILLFDPSFQLSFIAMLGLIYFAPVLERYLWRIPEAFQFRAVVAATIATQIFVLPLLLYMMGEISIVALPVNLLILIFVPLTMLLGFLVAITGLISPLLSLPFAYLAYFFLAYDLKVVEIFASVPFASVVVPSFPFVLMIFFYGVYALFIVRNKEH